MPAAGRGGSTLAVTLTPFSVAGWKYSACSLLAVHNRWCGDNRYICRCKQRYNAVSFGAVFFAFALACVGTASILRQRTSVDASAAAAPHTSMLTFSATCWPLPL
jgi:hypothetical protein